MACARVRDRAWRALASSSRCCGLVAFWDGAPVAQLGAAADSVAGGGAVLGELVRGVVASGRGNYLANLTLYPGACLHECRGEACGKAGELCEHYRKAARVQGTLISEEMQSVHGMM